MRLSFKLLLISEVVLLTTVLVLVLPVWRAMGKQVVVDMQNELKAIASTAALNIDGDLHDTIRTGDDADSEAFKLLRERLEKVRLANDIKVNHIYTFYPDGEQMRFAVMLNPPDELFIGNPYPKQELMRPVLDEGTMEATQLYTDEHGEWISAYAPIRNRAGEVVGVLEVDKDSEEYFREFHYHTYLTISLGLVALALSSILGWWVLQRLIIHPVSQIRDGVLALGRHDFRHRIELSTNDELQDLGHTLNDIANQLDVARMVQESLFPTSLPKHPKYRLAGMSTPCDATGGDYYDAFTLPDGRIAAVVADVAGHGIGASLLMASCRAALRGLSQTALPPGDLCDRLNHLLLEELSSGRFITMVYGVFDEDGSFTYCNYGHGPAMVSRNGVVEHLNSHRPPLGVEFDTSDDSQTTIQLQPGDRVFMGSDGLVEAMDVHDNQLGYEPVEKIIRDPATNSATVVEKLHTLEAQHRDGAASTDDVTLLCIDRV